MIIPIPSPVAISPVFNDNMLFDNSGLPLAGGYIYTYAAGSNSDEQTTFATAQGDVANTNPIVLDSSGRLSYPLWLATGYSYHLVLTTSDNIVLRSYDNVNGSYPALSTSLGTAVWNVVAAIPVYVSSTQFYLDGDFTLQFTKGNRVQWHYNDGTYGYGTSSSATSTSGRTYVSVRPDSSTLSNTVTAVSFSAAVVDNVIVDAGAVGYTPTFAYTGSNVGTQLQTINQLVTDNSRTYDAALNVSTYSVNAGFNPTTYTELALDIKFLSAYSGACTINVNNIGAVSLKQYNYTGTLSDPVIVAGMCSRVMYNGSVMVLLTQLPYTPPTPTPPPAPTFVATSGQIPINGTFYVTANASGYVQVTVSCFAHADYANFGEGNFSLYLNGGQVMAQAVRFFEYNGRTGGCGATLLCSAHIGAGAQGAFQVTYAGPGGAYSPWWSAITA